MFAFSIMIAPVVAFFTLFGFGLAFDSGARK